MATNAEKIAIAEKNILAVLFIVSGNIVITRVPMQIDQTKNIGTPRRGEPRKILPTRTIVDTHSHCLEDIINIFYIVCVVGGQTPVDKGVRPHSLDPIPYLHTYTLYFISKSKHTLYSLLPKYHILNTKYFFSYVRISK